MHYLLIVLIAALSNFAVTLPRGDQSTFYCVPEISYLKWRIRPDVKRKHIVLWSRRDGVFFVQGLSLQHVIIKSFVA